MKSHILITNTVDRKDAYLPVRTVLNLIGKDNENYQAKKDDIEFVISRNDACEINEMEAKIIEDQEKAKTRGIYHFKNYKEFYKKAYGIDLEESYKPDFEFVPKKKTNKPERKDEGDSSENEIWV